MASREIYYISTASLFCILPMLADLVNGLCTTNYRFPCKYFSFYPAFITAMSVVLRPSMTLDPAMPDDKVATQGIIATLAFMSTILANMLPSLASMDSETFLQNLISFSILVIVVIVKNCMDLHSGVIGEANLAHIQDATLVLILISAAITIPSLKQVLISKCHDVIQIFSSNHQQQNTAARQNRRQDEGRYEMMVEMCKPELVRATGMICLSGLVIYLLMIVDVLSTSQSGFRWCSLLTTESIGVVVGSIAPICRCLMASTG